MRSMRCGGVRRLVVLVAAAAVLVGTGPPASAAPVPLAIRIVGNHFVDGAGNTVRLLGVNHPSAEYACVDGYGYDDGHFDAADATAVASWGANAVRIPLNEDCWLGINGQPSSDQGADPPLTVTGYRQEIRDFVAALHQQGLYAILDLHWSAPGTQVALEQQPMPDKGHSVTFWSSVAKTFRSDPAVVFDLFNEPYDPTDPRSGSDPDPRHKVTWLCWENGTPGGSSSPCVTSAYDENGAPTRTYQIAGMRSLVGAVRTAGANQPVMLGGLDYANDLGEGDNGGAWLASMPYDPAHQIAASFHNYMGKGCDAPACWKTTVAHVARKVPVVTGEFAEDDFQQRRCADHTPSTFDERYMTWADAAGVSYLAWAWIVETQAEQDADGCSAYVLVQDYDSYTPASPNGVVVRNHLRAVATGG